MVVRVAIFAREPEFGQVKSRLAVSIGESRALAVYQQLVTHTLTTALGSGLPTELWVTGSDGCPLLTQAAAQLQLALRRQPVGDLGQRMASAVDAITSAGDSIILVGTDCPQLRAAHLVRAAQLLQQGPGMVVGPALDGGYYLLGLQAPEPRLFEAIAWGTDSVLQKTLAAAAECGLAVKQLDPLRDIDVGEDLDWAINEGFLRNP